MKKPPEVVQAEREAHAKSCAAAEALPDGMFLGLLATWPSEDDGDVSSVDLEAQRAQARHHKGRSRRGRH